MNSLFIILIRWTVLFALGWAFQWLLRARHARWRVILWRGILCGCVAVPFSGAMPISIIRIPIHRSAVVSFGDFAEHSSSGIANNSSVPVSSAIPSVNKPAELSAPAKPLPAPAFRAASIHWNDWLICLWCLGAAAAALRLAGIQMQLERIRRGSQVADDSIQNRALEIRKKLHVRRTVPVRVSDAVSSSFLSGLLRPAIFMPEKLVKNLSGEELSALLAHELAHVRRHDLFWCVAWQWARAALWFHPLVWKIPAAHNLACEQEADRIASGQIENSPFYRQMLARIALRIVALPPVETRLALNANSQIAQRLTHLDQGKSGVWNWKYTIAGVALVSALFLTATGCQFSQSDPSTALTPANFEFKTVPVIIQDENGKPVSGANVKVTGFRVKGNHSADAYSWRKDFGPRPTAVTDQEGRVLLKYPVMSIPEEKEYTGALIFHVEHPEFTTADIQTFYIDGSEKPIRLTRGLTLEVSGYVGPNHQPVTEIVPSLTEKMATPEDWQKKENGVMAFHKMSPGRHLIQLMGRLPSGEIGYSETVAFTAEMDKPSKFDLEIKPGIRLEGRVDNHVPRPVKNGRVMVSVRPKEFPTLLVIEDFYNIEDKYGHRSFWHSYRSIAEDGSFVFESVPPGEVDVVILCDGFVSKSVGELYNRRNGVLDKKPTILAVPQAFPLEAPVTKIEVATEPTATLEFTAATKTGAPIEGVEVGMFPSAFRMTGMFGWTKKSSEESFREIPKLPDPVFSGNTDKNGKVVLTNLPAEVWIMWANHPKYQSPIGERTGDRAIRVKFSPGETNVMNLVMEPMGTDFVGTAK